MISGRRIIEYAIIGLCGAGAVAFGLLALWMLFFHDGRFYRAMTMFGVLSFACGVAAVELFRHRDQCE